MAKRPSKLVDYERPPVAEVSLSAQFQSLRSLNAPGLGALWSLLRGRFPTVEQQPQLPHTIERIGVHPQPIQLPQISPMLGSDLTPRVWLINQAGTDLIQVQPDRFVRNWRRNNDPKIAYPSYADHVRPQFERDFAVFEKFIVDNELGTLVFDQCEISYVNQVRAVPGWTDPSRLDEMFRGWSPEFRERVALEMDAVSTRTRHLLRGPGGEFRGRLYIEIDSGIVAASKTDQPEHGFQMQLIARGAPIGDGLAGVLAFFDVGHDAIVGSFDRMTTERMHEFWGRKSNERSNH